MGDRGNIIIEPDGDCFTAPLFMYTHWSGSDLAEILKAALIRGRGRWDDPPYLARIIFCEMIQHSVLDETDYGLSNVPCDNQHDYLCVNIATKMVALREYSNDEKAPLKAKMLKTWTFDAFVKAEVEAA